MAGGSWPESISVEVLADDLQRQVVVLLDVEDVAQPVDVAVGVAPVPGRCPLGREQALALEEPDLRDRDVRELLGQDLQDLADAAPIRGHLVLPGCVHQVDHAELADLHLVAVGAARTSPSISVRLT